MTSAAFFVKSLKNLLKTNLPYLFLWLLTNISQAAKTGTGKVLYFKTKEEFEEKISELISNGDTVLIKASNGMKFKEIVEKFKNMGE